MSMKKRGTIVCLLLAMVWVLAGCGFKETDKADPKELISRMVEVAEGTVVTQNESVAELKLWYGDELTGMDATMSFKAKNKYDKESVRSASEIAVNDNGLSTINVKYNLVEEQGILYHYAWDEKSGWVKYEACFAKEDVARNFVSTMNLENAEILGLETEDIQVGGKEAYKLSLILKDAKIRELLFETGVKYVVMGREYASIDLSDVTVVIDYYVDPETAQVLKVEAKLEGMGNFLREWIEFLFVEDVERYIGLANISECTLVYDHISYEDAVLPKMPFEEKKGSKWIHQQDEVYTINMLDCEVDITWPKGWYAKEEEKDFLMLYNIDDTIIRSYALDMNVDEQGIRDGYLAPIIERVKEGDLYVDEQEGPVIGVFKTYEILLKNGVVSFAYTKLDDFWLSITVADYTSTRLDKSLPEVLETVKWE